MPGMVEANLVLAIPRTVQTVHWCLANKIVVTIEITWVFDFGWAFGYMVK